MDYTIPHLVPRELFGECWCTLYDSGLLPLLREHDTNWWIQAVTRILFLIYYSYSFKVIITILLF